MNHKRFFAGLFVLLGLASGVTGCIAADGEGSEEWATDDDVSEEAAIVKPDTALVIAPRQYPNCGILACPSGTTCQFDSSKEPRCTAPAGMTCGEVDCGPYYYCQMTQTGAICVPGSSDI